MVIAMVAEELEALLISKHFSLFGLSPTWSIRYKLSRVLIQSGG